MNKPAPPQSHRLRKGRFSESGRAYLLTTVTCQRKPVFENFRVGRLVVNELRWANIQGLADTLAFVLMPDHLHWLIVLREGALESLARTVKSRSAITINREFEWRGPIWQAGFHDHVLRQDEDVKTMARYVVANPLRAGLVQRIGDYPLWDAVWL